MSNGITSQVVTAFIQNRWFRGIGMKIVSIIVQAINSFWKCLKVTGRLRLSTLVWTAIFLPGDPAYLTWCRYCLNNSTHFCCRLQSSTAKIRAELDRLQPLLQDDPGNSATFHEDKAAPVLFPTSTHDAHRYSLLHIFRSSCAQCWLNVLWQLCWVKHAICVLSASCCKAVATLLCSLIW